MTKQGEHDFVNKNGIINLANSSAVGHPIVQGQALPLRSIAFASLPTTGLPPVAIAWCPDFQYGTPPTSWAGPIVWNGTAWVPLYAGSLPAATVAGQPLNFSQAGGGGGATDWANPGAIGSNTRNTAAFTTISGSRYVVPTPIADGTTLTKALHVGNAVKINGGTINLPTDGTWAVDDEIEFIVVGTNATTIQWVGNSISGKSGASAAQIIGGGIGNAAIIKKAAAGVAYLFSGDAVNLASPPPIGNITPNTAKFRSIVGSWAYNQTVLANGTTLVRDTHIGQFWLVNGGTINLPLDGDWQIGDEVRFIVSGTTNTTISGNGATFDAGPYGTVSSIVIAGFKGQQVCIKKIGTNSALVDWIYFFLSGLLDTNISGPIMDDELMYNGSKWVNSPGVFSIRDKWKRAFISPGSGSSLTTFHLVLTSTATVAHPTPSAGTAYNEADRFTFSCTATAGNVATQRVGTPKLWRGNAPGKGGFRVLVPFGCSALQPGMRASITLSSETSAPTNIDPIAGTSTSGSKVGVAINNNTGTWNVFSNLNGVAPTFTALNASFPVDITTWYEMLIECDPNGSAIFYTIVNKNTGATTGKTSFGTNIPASTDRLHINYWVTNNATAAIAGLALGEIKMEFG